MTDKKDNAIKLALDWMEKTALFIPTTMDEEGIAIAEKLYDALAEQPAIKFTDKMSIDVPDQPLFQKKLAQKRIEELMDTFKDVDQSGPLLGMGQPAQQEPATWMKDCADFWEHYTCISEASQENYKAEAQMWVEKLRTSPPASKPWVGLSEEDRRDIWRKSASIDGAINATAAKLREKNT